MKYIVKNCPALRDSYYAYGKVVKNECSNDMLHDTLCKDRTDCPIKQVVEVCLRYYPVSLIRALQDEILQILQVEEVEE